MRSAWRTSLLAVALSASALPAGASAAALRAGAAATDLTPPVGTPMFAYTARSLAAGPGNLPEVGMNIVADPPTGLYAKTFAPSRGIHTRVRSRALVLDAGRGRFALVQVDLGGVPYLLTQQVAARVADLGIPAEHIVISATHTHASTGPIWPSDSTGYGALGGDLFDSRIFELTVRAVADSIRAAHARLAPARAGVGTADVRTATRNRSLEPFRMNPDVPVDEQGARAAAIDPLLTVIRVERPDGTPVAAWSNFAVHPTSFGADNLLFSGDNAGYAERVAEERIGGGVINVWTNGNQGDISPDGDPDVAERELPPVAAQDGEARRRAQLQYAPNAFSQAHMTGRRMGEGIAAAWRDARDRLTDTLDLDARRTFVDFDGTPADGEPVGPVPVLGAGGIGAPGGFCAPVDDLAGPGQGRKFPALAGAGLVPRVAPVTLLRVGRLGVLAVPSEITRQMGARIRSAVAAAGEGSVDRVVLAGLTNSYISYTATPEEYDACHYEGSFTLYGRRQGARYREIAASLMRALTGEGAAPDSAAEPSAVGPPTGVGLPPRVTRQAGQATEQPAEVLRRFSIAEFRWRGGDPSVDAPRGETFVSLQRRTPASRRRGARRAQAGGWQTVATDDSFADTVEQGGGDTWVERFQFAECDRTGTYRFTVTGVADRGAGPAPYTVTSRAFEVRPIGLTARAPVVSGRTVRVIAEYPDPGRDVLVALPRRVRTGSAVLEVRPPRGRTRRVLARPDAERLAFTAQVPAGARVRVLGVRDGCGNGFGAGRVAAQREQAGAPARRRAARRPRYTG